MPKSRSSQIAMGGLAIVVVVFLLSAAIYFADGRSGIAHSTGAAAFGWLVPFVAGAFIAFTVWGLLAGTESRHPHAAQLPICPSCGSRVRAEWRLCPTCGGRLPVLAPSIPRSAGASAPAPEEPRVH